MAKRKQFLSSYLWSLLFVAPSVLGNFARVKNFEHEDEYETERDSRAFYIKYLTYESTMISSRLYGVTPPRMEMPERCQCVPTVPCGP